MCKSTLFKSYFFWILLSLCLWRTGVPPPRFPLVSFCRYCSAPAVFFRFRSKNRACFIQASKRIPLQSLSVSNLPYICTHPPYRRNWLWGDSFSLITSHIIAYKRLCFISIFLLLFLWRLFSLPIIQIYFL